MSHTGSDPHGTKSKGPATVYLEEVKRFEQLEASGQWARARAIGLTVHIHAPHMHGDLGAWVRADELEEFLAKSKYLGGPDISGDSEIMLENVQETKAP